MGAGDSGAVQATTGTVPGSSSGGAGGRPPETWYPLPAEGGADLQSVHGCIEEIENCNKGLAYLDHIFGLVVDKLSDAEEVWGSQEAEAAKSARADLAGAATATEVKAGITRYVERTPSARTARDEVRTWRRRKEKVDRWMRTLEKRLSAAQSAQNGHDILGRYGGGA